MAGFSSESNGNTEMVPPFEHSRTDVSLKARSGRRPSASNRSTLSPSYYSAVQINVVKGCVNKKRAYATFDHVFWTAE